MGWQDMKDELGGKWKEGTVPAFSRMD